MARGYAMKLKVILYAASVVGLMTVGAEAACFGSGAFSTCSDGAGNRYNVQRYGNTTNLKGYNSRTGSSWSQNSTTFGNTTIHSGRSADGGSWRIQQQRIGGSTFYSGHDSQGNYVRRTCTSYGCY